MQAQPSYLTRHAAQRAVQRSIPLTAVAAIHAYGSPFRHYGALALCLDRRALDLARDDLPTPLARDLGRYRGTYVVTIEPAILTVARRTRRRRS